MFSPDVDNMHCLLTKHLQGRINLCIHIRSFIGGFVHLTWHFTGTWSTFHGMHVTDVKIWHWFRSHRCLLTPEPCPSVLDQVTASCDRNQTRTVAGKVTCRWRIRGVRWGEPIIKEPVTDETGAGRGSYLLVDMLKWDSWNTVVAISFWGSRGAPTLQLVLYKDIEDFFMGLSAR